MIYQAVCPAGSGGCHKLGPVQMNTLRRQLTTYVRSRSSSSTTAAYYILDDYVPGLATVLASAYNTIREADPHRATVCALALPVVQINADQTQVTGAITKFRRALRNYSPSWCNAVMIYAYARSSRTPETRGEYDWRMSTTLSKAVSALRARGWSPTRSPLIGVPQAFGYWPRLPSAGSPGPGQYRSAPTESELADQITAYCKAGAVSIVGYAWNDQSSGHVSELYNTEALRKGFTTGVRDCRTSYWG
ncbi:hypothetical protein GCM10027613_12210 [Microlunatus endophyticus]